MGTPPTIETVTGKRGAHAPRFFDVRKKILGKSRGRSRTDLGVDVFNFQVIFLLTFREPFGMIMA